MDPIVYYFLLALPVILFVIYYKTKDNQKRRELSTPNLEAFMWSPRWHSIYNTLSNCPTDAMPPKDVIGLGALVAKSRLEIAGTDPNSMDEKDRQDLAMETTGTLVGMAHRGQDEQLAEVIFEVLLHTGDIA